MAVAAPATLPELSVILPDGMVLRGADPLALAALVRCGFDRESGGTTPLSAASLEGLADG